MLVLVLVRMDQIPSFEREQKAMHFAVLSVEARDEPCAVLLRRRTILRVDASRIDGLMD